VQDTEQLTIRGATPDDLGDVVAAYNAGIQERVATFETTLRSPGEVVDWLHDGQPFVVAEQDGRVLGWGSTAF
jgi:L-amino acid N-acyltransferase YncA